MRRFKLLVPMSAIFLLLLAGCARRGNSVQKALDFRTDLMAADECTFSADVTADYTDRVYQFSMDCSYDPASNTAGLTVTAPDTISGIAARVDGENAKVQFADASLELGTMAGGQVAPMQLPQLLGCAWTQSYIDAMSREDDGYLVTYRSGYGSDELVIDTYFSSQMSPTRCEIYSDNVCVLAAEIEDFSVS